MKNKVADNSTVKVLYFENIDEKMSFVILLGQLGPGPGQRTLGKGKKMASLKFVKDKVDWDIFYGTANELPDWAKVNFPDAAWAFDMHGFWDIETIRNATQLTKVPFFILSYVPNNGDKAQSAIDDAVAHGATFVLVYAKEDKANFIQFAQNNLGKNPIGLCDDQYDNAASVADAGFCAVHCSIGTDPEFKEDNVQKSKAHGGIELAETLEDLTAALLKK